jgi:hypothetical protein
VNKPGGPVTVALLDFLDDLLGALTDARREPRPTPFVLGVVGDVVPPIPLVIIARLALFLIDCHHSLDVLVWVLGESSDGTLVSDFYAACNGLDCAKQRCLVHLLRELAKLREDLPRRSVRAFVQPLIELFQDAIQLGKDREKLGRTVFDPVYRRLIDRLDDWMLRTHSRHPDCVRIWKRLYKH